MDVHILKAYGPHKLDYIDFKDWGHKVGWVWDGGGGFWEFWGREMIKIQYMKFLKKKFSKN